MKTCMQFSIRRPKLPSSETHPEENAYKRLDVSAWLHHLNEAGQVEEEYKLRKVRRSRGGMCALLVVSAEERSSGGSVALILPGAPACQKTEWLFTSLSSISLHKSNMLRGNEIVSRPPRLLWA